MEGQAQEVTWICKSKRHNSADASRGPLLNLLKCFRSHHELNDVAAAQQQK